MGFYGRTNTYAGAGTKRRTPARKGGFAASPAGKHRRLAMNAFALARKAQASGNVAHYRRMVAFGKRALSLSRAEYRLWKKGLVLRAKAFAAQKRSLAAARSARVTGFKRSAARFSYR